ncbi:hypothetical protein BDP27DRAFT_1406990, partial [Rhodocollybia butyracea]
MSEDRETETGTILTSTGTTNSSFTIHGPGALSGKAIKRFGTVVVKGVDAIVYRRRLARIESILQEDRDAMTHLNLKARGRLYCDLFELSRSVYSMSIRTRALPLIMRKIGEMDLKDIAAAIVHLWSSEWQDDLKEMLSEILLCIRMYREPRLMPNVLDALRHDELAKLKPYHLAGLNAYGHGILEFAGGVDISTAEFRAPFLILLRLMVSLSTTPTISRALLEIEILEFIIETSFQEIGPQYYEDSGESLLQAVLRKLDPIQDIRSISQIQELLDLRVAMKSTVFPQVKFKVGIKELLMMIEYDFLPKNLKESGAVTNLNFKTQKHYKDLLKWSRFGYRVSIRTRAFRLIMHKIGRRDSEDLATAIVHLPSSECQDLLRDMLLCIRMYRLMPGPGLDAYGHEAYAYGHEADAYSHEAYKFAQQKVRVLRAVFRVPFLISLRSMVSLSTNPTFSRVLLGLKILEFIIESSFQGGKLDPIQDIYHISQIQMLINRRSRICPQGRFKGSKQVGFGTSGGDSPAEAGSKESIHQKDLDMTTKPLQDRLPSYLLRKASAAWPPSSFHTDPSGPQL